MSGDTYTRVARAFGSREPARFEEHPNGTYKVVPADAIVIERSELPEVMVADDDPGAIRADARDGQEYGGTWLRRGVFRDPEAACRSHAVEYLALAAHLREHLREHPPVDEREVEALAHALHTRNGTTETLEQVARRLLATGKVHVDVEADRG